MPPSSSLETWVRERLSRRGQPCSPERLEELLARRGKIVEQLCSTLNETRCKLEQGEAITRPDVLLEAFALAWLLQVREAFPLLLDVCQTAGEHLEEVLGIYFVLEEIPYVLESLLDRDWHQLQAPIENEALPVELRASYVQALVLGVATEKCPEDQVRFFLGGLLNGILEDTLKSPSFCDALLDCVSELGGQDWLEQIREIYGRELCSSEVIPLGEMMSEMEADPEEKLQRLRERVQHHRFGQVPSSIEDETLREMTRKFHQEREQEDKLPSWSARNAPCGCGSGKKYKKCCLLGQREVESISLQHIRIKHEARDLVPSPLVTLSDHQQLMEMLSQLMEPADPARDSCILADLNFFLEKYPQSPLLWFQKYLQLRAMDRSKEAFNVLEELLERFPDELFGISEYACYLIRRGEPDRAWGVLRQAESLEMFAPGKTEFHIDEVQCFYIALGHYYASVGDLKRAEGCKKLLESTGFACAETKEIGQAIRAARVAEQQRKRALATSIS